MDRGNLIFVACTFGSMLVGVALPGVGEPLYLLPPLTLMAQLLLAFLTTSAPGAARPPMDWKAFLRFMALKMLVAPLVCCGVFALILPQFALGALLLAGTAVGVLGPFYSARTRGDVPFTITAVVVSSLVLPFTMPTLVLLYTALSGQTPAEGLWRAFLQTGVALALYIFLPFLASKGLWAWRPGMAQRILGRRFLVSTTGVTISMFVIFSQYALPLRENPLMVLQALAAACALAALFTVLGFFISLRRAPQRKLAVMICLGIVNSVLMVIISSQFFALPEVLLTAMYSVPLLLLLLPFAWYSRRALGPG